HGAFHGSRNSQYLFGNRTSTSDYCNFVPCRTYCIYRTLFDANGLLDKHGLGCLYYRSCDWTHNNRGNEATVRAIRNSSRVSSCHACLCRGSPRSMRAVSGHCPVLQSLPPSDRHFPRP
ncbi:hypothetical protein PFISCL1PPCAC_21899, partial [Pristionchus fissidentatus]